MAGLDGGRRSAWLKRTIGNAPQLSPFNALVGVPKTCRSYRLAATPRSRSAPGTRLPFLASATHIPTGDPIVTGAGRKINPSNLGEGSSVFIEGVAAFKYIEAPKDVNVNPAAEPRLDAVCGVSFIPECGGGLHRYQQNCINVTVMVRSVSPSAAGSASLIKGLTTLDARNSVIRLFRSRVPLAFSAPSDPLGACGCQLASPAAR
jgi:hypothetical protein